MAWQPFSLSWGGGSSRRPSPAPDTAAAGATAASHPRACSMRGPAEVVPSWWGCDWPGTGWGGSAASGWAFWRGLRARWRKWWAVLTPQPLLYFFSLYLPIFGPPLKKKPKKTWKWCSEMILPIINFIYYFFYQNAIINWSFF